MPTILTLYLFLFQEWFVVNAQFAATVRAIEEWLDKNTVESEAEADEG